MPLEDPFYPLRRNFFPRDINQVTGAAAEMDNAVAQFGQVAGQISALSQLRRGVGPIGLPDSGTADHQAPIVREREADVFHGRTDARGIASWFAGGVIGNTAAFGGAVEVMDFETVLPE